MSEPQNVWLGYHEILSLWGLSSQHTEERAKLCSKKNACVPSLKGATREHCRWRCVLPIQKLVVHASRNWLQLPVTLPETEVWGQEHLFNLYFLPALPGVVQGDAPDSHSVYLITAFSELLLKRILLEVYKQVQCMALTSVKIQKIEAVFTQMF